MRHPLPIVRPLHHTLVLTITIPFILFTPLDTSDTNVDFRGHGKPKRFADFGEVERVDVEYLFQAVRGVCLEIGSVAFFGGGVEVVVFG